MTHIEYFKLQAKNLFRDYKTQTSYIDDVDGNTYYKYSPKYFDIDELVLADVLKEENLSLMKIQHVFANMIGFKKWADLSKASDSRLELAKLLFDNRDKVSLDDWEFFYGKYDTDSQLNILKHKIENNLM